MGCDIHMVVERKIGPDWIAVDTMQGHHKAYTKKGEYDWSSPVATVRNYNRFAALAGVRGEGPNARGLPENTSQTAKALSDEWGVDGHSHSWVELDEAARVFLATEYTEPDAEDYSAKFPGSYYFGVDELDEKGDEYRLVFWFDN